MDTNNNCVDFTFEETSEEIIVDLSRGSEEEGSRDFVGHVLAEDVISRVTREVVQEFMARRELYELNASIAANSKVDEEVRDQAARACQILLPYSLFYLKLEQSISLEIDGDEDPLDAEGLTFKVCPGLQEVIQESFVYEEDVPRVYAAIRKMLRDQPEYFYPDRELRAKEYDISRDGKGMFLKLNEKQEVPFSSGDDTIHVGQGLEPERVEVIERSDVRIPYLRDCMGDTITYPSPVFRNQKWVKEQRPALSVYFTSVVNGREQTFMWTQVYAKYCYIEQAMANALAARNFAFYNKLADDACISRRKALPAISARLKELRQMVKLFVAQVQDDSWDIATRRPVGAPKGLYFTRKVELFGRQTQVFVRALVH